MAAAYFENQENADATFELFIRNLPKNRSYLVAAGLEQAVEYLTELRFRKEHIRYLRKHPAFRDISGRFFRYLAKLRFHGDLWAMPEGTVFFANEPILRVTAPIIEAQLVETYLLSTINFQTLIATKAARVVQSARGKGVVEFGGRRAHGPDAALLAARASYIGGCIGTSNVLAGYMYNIPIYGTMAHSFVMNYESEEEAFQRFCKTFPSNPALLIDTYDTIKGAKKSVTIRPPPTLVRLDSGDRYELSKRVRKILNNAGLKKTRIFASGDLNEFILNELTTRRAPIDSFGVGTELVTSRDDPALQGIYKIVETRRNGELSFRVKTSEGKRTLPGAKQIYRICRGGVFVEDILALENEAPPPHANPILLRILVRGRRARKLPSIQESRRRAKNEVSRLPSRFKELENPQPSPVRLSSRLQTLAESLWRNPEQRIIQD